MPIPVELDLTRWTKVSPEGNKQKVKALSFACFYYRGGQTPPELASEGTEIAANGEVTIERSQAPYWFRTKKASATEIQLPSILELKLPELENVTGGEIFTGTITTGNIAEGAVTAAKIANVTTTEGTIPNEGVGFSKVAKPSIPAAGAEKTVVKSASGGVARKVIAVLVGDGAKTTWAIETGEAGGNK